MVLHWYALTGKSTVKNHKIVMAELDCASQRVCSPMVQGSSSSASVSNTMSTAPAVRTSNTPSTSLCTTILPYHRCRTSSSRCIEADGLRTLDTHRRHIGTLGRVSSNGKSTCTKVIGGHPLLAKASEAVEKWKWLAAAEEKEGMIELRFHPDLSPAFHLLDTAGQNRMPREYDLWPWRDRSCSELGIASAGTRTGDSLSSAFPLQRLSSKSRCDSCD